MPHYLIMDVISKFVNVVERNCNTVYLYSHASIHKRMNELNTNSIIVPKQEIIHNDIFTLKQEWATINQLFNYYLLRSLL